MIYFFQETGFLRNRVKIGCTENIKARLRSIQTCSPSKLKILLILPGDEQNEFVYHQRFSSYRLQGEWFKYGLKLKLFVWINQVKSVDIETKELPLEIATTPPVIELEPEPVDTEQHIIKLFDEGLSATKITETIYGYKNQRRLEHVKSILEKE